MNCDYQKRPLGREPLLLISISLLLPPFFVLNDLVASSGHCTKIGRMSAMGQ